MRGEVIGVNTAIISPTGGSIGLGFAVPSDLAANVVQQLKTYGETRRGWLGVRIQDVTDEIAESLGLDTARGALIAGIVESGPSAGGPLKSGDIILEFDGKQINDAHDLPRIIAGSPIDSDLLVKLFRDGGMRNVTIRLALQEGSDEDEEELEEHASDEGEAVPDIKPGGILVELGFALAALDVENRKLFAINESVEGVLVTEVRQGSEAFRQGIAAGDVIVEIGQEFVATVEEVENRLIRLREQDRRNAQVLISSKDGDLRFVAIRLD
jgi:serine protease Do